MSNRPEPILRAILTKEGITSVVILLFLFARDAGINLAEDTKLQILLVVTLVGGALAGSYARDRSTPIASPRLPEGTVVKTTDQSGTTTGTTKVTPT